MCIRAHYVRSSSIRPHDFVIFFFFFNDTSTTESYTYCHTLPLHDALPISERKANPAYTACSRQIAALRTEIDAIRATSADKAEVRALLGRIKAVQKERRKIPSVDPMDPNFRRLRYCRYADD